MQGSNLSRIVEQAHEELRSEEAQREWMVMTNLVMSQMTSREFLDKIGWKFEQRPHIPSRQDLPELRKQYELEAKAALMSHLLRQCLNGAICKVNTFTDHNANQDFIRFDVALTKPFDCHVTFPVRNR